MTALPLASLPAGSDVFIDANIFIFGLTSQSGESWELLSRCSIEEVYGFSLFEIVNEATHKLMLAEAVANGHITKESASKLEKKPRVIQQLTAYWAQTRRILDLNLAILPTDDGILRDAQGVRTVSGIMTNDSMIVACMNDLGITCLASYDHRFDRVNGIQRYSPSDLP